MFARNVQSDAEKRENCVVCAIWPVLFFIPYHCIEYECPHRNRKSQETKFSLSMVRTILTKLLLLISLKKLFDTCLNLISADVNIYMLFYLHEIFILAAYAVIIFSCVISSDRKLDSLNGHQKLIDYVQMCGSYLSLNEADMKRLRKRSLLCVFVCSVQISIYSYFYFAEMHNAENVLSYIFFTFFGEMFITFCLLMHSYVFYMEGSIQVLLQRKLFAKVRKVLSNKSGDDGFVAANLEKCRFFYILIMKNFRVFLRFYGKNILLVYTVLLLLLIYNVFFILLVIKTVQFDSSLVLVMLNSYFNCVVIIQFSWVGEWLENVVSTNVLKQYSQ